MNQNKQPLFLEKSEVIVNRRSFLKLTTGAGLSIIAAPSLLIPKSIEARELGQAALKQSKMSKDLFLSFYNRHTGESLTKCNFWAGDEYNPEALKAINKLFRDHRTNMIHKIDPKLLHILHKIQKQLDTIEPFHLISGYRSPQSNSMLREMGRGVAKRSLHVSGKAADIYVPGRSLKQVQAAAKSLRAGGVGRYSQFVHVDTGRQRYWGAL
jgi:uncharacterized protein YcbK (DUF882 family)